MKVEFARDQRTLGIARLSIDRDLGPSETELIDTLAEKSIYLYAFYRTDVEWLPALQRMTREAHKATAADPLAADTLPQNGSIRDALKGLAYLRGFKRQCLRPDSSLAGNPLLGAMFRILDAHAALLRARGLDVPIREASPRSAAEFEKPAAQKPGDWAKSWSYKGKRIARAGRTLEVGLFDYYTKQLGAIHDCATMRAKQATTTKSRKQHSDLATASSAVRALLERATRGMLR